MADNVEITAGSGVTIATDDVGSAHYQVIKIGVGAANAVDGHLDFGQTTKSASLPVTLASDQGDIAVTLDSESVAVTNAGITTIAGAVAGTEMQVDVVASALPTGAATAAKQPALGTAGTPSADVISIQGVASGTVVPVSDGGGALTVDGTVAATQSGAWNVGTVTTITNVVHVDDNSSTISVDDGGGAITVDGTVTANLSATDNAVLDDVAAKLGTIDADTSALNGCVGGTELQCDIVGALPAGTNAIGKLAANSGVDIGDVDVTSIVPGVAATNLGKAEDAAHNSGDTGVYVLAVRDDALAAHSGTDGDYESLHTDASGGLYVNPVPGAMWSACEDETDAATDDEIVPAPGAGLSLYITDIIVTNDATSAITIKFIEDTASAKTNKTGTQKVPASGGFVANLRTPIKLTANKNFGYTSTGTSNYSVFVAGYTAA